nr:hypothetical protein 1634Bnrm3_p123 [Cryptomonas sp.]
MSHRFFKKLEKNIFKSLSNFQNILKNIEKLIIFKSYKSKNKKFRVNKYGKLSERRIYMSVFCPSFCKWLSTNVQNEALIFLYIRKLEKNLENNVIFLRKITGIYIANNSKKYISGFILIEKKNLLFSFILNKNIFLEKEKVDEFWDFIRNVYLDKISYNII